MSYRDCAACKDAGTKPKRGTGARIVCDPAIMSGTPTIEKHGLGAEFMARRVYTLGLKEQMEDYGLTREEILVACWWAGTYGPRPLRKAFGEWAKVAGRHLWYGCVQIPDPPQKAG